MLAATMVVFAAGNTKADVVDLQQVLHGPTRCDHVIDLMMRYGINNDQEQLRQLDDASFTDGSDVDPSRGTR